MIDREHYIVVRREGLEWCVFTEEGSVCMRFLDAAIQAAMTFASRKSEGHPIRVEIKNPEADEAGLTLDAASARQ